MKYIKSNLLNRMEDLRMNDCLITHIESEVCDTINDEAIVGFQYMKTC